MATTLDEATQEVVALCAVKEQSPDKAAVESALKTAAVNILRLYDWTFLEVTGTVVTVVNVYQYTLTPQGDNPPEAEAVLDLIYDVNAAEKRKGTPLEHLDWALARTDPTFNPVASTSGKRYTVMGKSNTNTPIIQLEFTPQTADLVIDFRYKIKVDPGDPFNRFIPELWDYIVNKACEKFYPYPAKSEMFGKLANTAKAAAIATSVRKPNDVVRETLDAETKETNLALNSMVSDCDTNYYL